MAIIRDRVRLLPCLLRLSRHRITFFLPRCGIIERICEGNSVESCGDDRDAENWLDRLMLTSDSWHVRLNGSRRGPSS